MWRMRMAICASLSATTDAPRPTVGRDDDPAPAPPTSDARSGSSDAPRAGLAAADGAVAIETLRPHGDEGGAAWSVDGPRTADGGLLDAPNERREGGAGAPARSPPPPPLPRSGEAAAVAPPPPPSGRSLAGAAEGADAPPASGSAAAGGGAPPSLF